MCQLGYHPCHSDASCTIVIDTESVCTCNSCYEGTGIECRQRVCPSENMECVVSSGECECREDFSPSTDGDSCIREGIYIHIHQCLPYFCLSAVSEVFSNLSRDVSQCSYNSYHIQHAIPSISLSTSLSVFRPQASRHRDTVEVCRDAVARGHTPPHSASRDLSSCLSPPEPSGNSD